VLPAEPKADLVFFSFDVELTGSHKRYDRIIELGMVACDSTGAELPNGRWAERFSADGVLITDSAFKVHGIAVQDLRGKPAFAERAQALVDWMEGVRTGAGATAAVLVAHNGNACDFGFLAAEMARAQRALPAALKYTLDTLQSVRRFRESHCHHRESHCHHPGRGSRSAAPRTAPSVCSAAH